MKVVLDTDVIVAAMCSPTGAAVVLPLAVLEGHVVLAANVALVIEYEATCSRAENVSAAGLSVAQAGVFLDALADLIVPLETHYLWCPLLRDLSDEMVLEAAVNGQAQAIVTFNLRDYGVAHKKFGVNVMLLRDALRKVQRNKRMIHQRNRNLPAAPAALYQGRRRKNGTVRRHRHEPVCSHCSG